MLANILHVSHNLTVCGGEMEWTRDQTVVLIDLYRSHPVLWDVTCTDYRNKIKKADAWRDISAAMGVERAEVERKMRSVLAQFRRERKKTKDHKSGDGADDVYKSSWFAFESLSFLDNTTKPHGTHERGLQVRNGCVCDLYMWV